jgi:5-methyltetrahydrofolate--homocysteine methyltransferase
VATKPEAVEKVHRGFLEAGADVIETDTFGGTSIVLAEYDLADRAYELNKAAAELAKESPTEYSTPEKAPFCGRFHGARHQAAHPGPHRFRHVEKCLR